MAQLDRLFQELVKRQASDLHLVSGLPIKMRIDGDLEIIRDRALGEEEATLLLRELVAPQRWEEFEKRRELDFAYGIPGVVRLRGNYFRHLHGTGAVFRVIPETITPAEELGLPRAVHDFAHKERGLILVTGPTGSGKSTTLAALIDSINRTYPRHIVTIEEPVEFVHPDKRSVVLQREVGTHTASFAQALKSAVRQDPDVILVGELRDRDTMSQALEAAEMGFLVFGTLHTNSAAKTVDRVIDLFPAEHHSGVRQALASCLVGVVSQLLLRAAEGKGRVAVHEVLLANGAVANTIREGNTAKLYSQIQSGRGQGMQTMDWALADAVKKGLVDREDAWRRVQDKSRFDDAVKRSNT